MASKFTITAELNLQTKNLNTVVGNLRKQFQGANLNIKIKDLANAQAQIQKIGTAAKTSSKSFNDFSSSVVAAAKRFSVLTAATGTIVGFARALKTGVSDAIEFEREIVKIAQATGKTVNQLKGLANEITKVSTEFGVSSKELVGAARNLTQAGFAADKVTGALKVLAQTEVAATFKSIEDTTEGAIALLNQFGRASQQTGTEVQFLEKSLSAINQVSKDFAVESSDLITAVRTTGSAFEAAGGSLDELLALFTSVRSTTRESAESISTGFRTIFTRVQRVDTINNLKQLGIELQDASGKFVGPIEATKRLSAALNAIDPRDFRFNLVVEQLGGFRQVSKVIPLIQQFHVSQKALNVAQGSSGSLAKDAATAQQALAVQIAQVREEFKALIREMTSSDVFRSIVQDSLALASAMIKVASSIKPLLPLLAGMGALKLGQAFLPAIKQIGGIGRKNAGGTIHAFASGGLVPGVGNSDTVPAMLTPGEFVIRKSSVNSLGLEKLAKMNGHAIGGKETGKNFRQQYAMDSSSTSLEKFQSSATKENVSERSILKGGLGLGKQAKFDKDYGAVFLRPNDIQEDIPARASVDDILSRYSGSKSKSTLDQDYIKQGLKKQGLGTGVNFKIHSTSIDGAFKDKFQETLFGDLIKLVDNNADSLMRDAGVPVDGLNEGATYKLLKASNLDQTLGNIFEATLKTASGKFSDSVDTGSGNQPFDFPTGLGSRFENILTQKIGSIPTDAKTTFSDQSIASLINKGRDQIAQEAIETYAKSEGIQEFFKKSAPLETLKSHPAFKSLSNKGENVQDFAKRYGFGISKSGSNTGFKKAVMAMGGRISYFDGGGAAGGAGGAGGAAGDAGGGGAGGDAGLGPAPGLLPGPKMNYGQDFSDDFQNRFLDPSFPPYDLGDHSDIPDPIFKPTPPPPGFEEWFMQNPDAWDYLNDMRESQKPSQQEWDEGQDLPRKGRPQWGSPPLFPGDDWGKSPADPNQIPYEDLRNPRGPGDDLWDMMQDPNWPDRFPKEGMDDFMDWWRQQPPPAQNPRLLPGPGFTGLGGRKNYFADGGTPSGTDTVPAMLTPGEYVINKASAQSIGYSTLNKMNQVGKFASGGSVQHLAGGGMKGPFGNLPNVTANPFTPYTLPTTTSNYNPANPPKANVDMAKANAEIQQFIADLDKAGASLEKLSEVKKVLTDIAEDGGNVSASMKAITRVMNTNPNQKNEAFTGLHTQRITNAALQGAVQNPSMGKDARLAKAQADALAKQKAKEVAETKKHTKDLTEEGKKTKESLVKLNDSFILFGSMAVSTATQFSGLSDAMKEGLSATSSTFGAMFSLGKMAIDLGAGLMAARAASLAAAAANTTEAAASQASTQADLTEAASSGAAGAGSAAGGIGGLIAGINPLTVALVAVSAGFAILQGRQAYLAKQTEESGNKFNKLSSDLLAGSNQISKMKYVLQGEAYTKNKLASSTGTFSSTELDVENYRRAKQGLGPVNDELIQEAKDLNITFFNMVNGLEKSRKDIENAKTGEALSKAADQINTNAEELANGIAYAAETDLGSIINKEEIERNKSLLTEYNKQQENNIGKLKESFAKTNFGPESEKIKTAAFDTARSIAFINSNFKNLDIKNEKTGKKLTTEEVEKLTSDETKKAGLEMSLEFNQLEQQVVRTKIAMAAENAMREKLLGTINEQIALSSAITVAQNNIEDFSTNFNDKLARMTGEGELKSNIPNKRTLEQMRPGAELNKALDFINNKNLGPGASKITSTIESGAVLKDSIKPILESMVGVAPLGARAQGNLPSASQIVSGELKSRLAAAGIQDTSMADKISAVVKAKEEEKGNTGVLSKEDLDSIYSEVESILKEAGESGNKIIEVFANYENAQRQAFAKIIELTNQEAEYRAKAVEIDMEGLNNRAGLAVNPREESFFRNEAAKKEQEAAQVRLGPDSDVAGSVSGIVARIKAVQKDLSKDNLGGAEGQQLQNRLVNLNRALEDLGNTSVALANAQKEESDALQQLNDVKSAKEEFAFGSNESRMKTMQTENFLGAYLNNPAFKARIQASGGLNETARENIHQYASRFRNTQLGGAMGNRTGQDILDQISNDEAGGRFRGAQSSAEQALAAARKKTDILMNQRKEAVLAKAGLTGEAKQGLTNELAAMTSPEEILRKENTIALDKANANTETLNKKLEELGVQIKPLAEKEMAALTTKLGELKKEEEGLKASIDTLDDSIRKQTGRPTKAEELAGRKATGGLIYASNGRLIDFKPQGTDTVPAMLSQGEFVVRKKAVDKFGADNLAAINSGNFSPEDFMSGGGAISAKHLMGGGGPFWGMPVPNSIIGQAGNAMVGSLNDTANWMTNSYNSFTQAPFQSFNDYGNYMTDSFSQTAADMTNAFNSFASGGGGGFGFGSQPMFNQFSSSAPVNIGLPDLQTPNFQLGVGFFEGGSVDRDTLMGGGGQHQEGTLRSRKEKMIGLIQERLDNDNTVDVSEYNYIWNRIRADQDIKELLFKNGIELPELPYDKSSPEDNAAITEVMRKVKNNLEYTETFEADQLKYTAKDYLNKFSEDGKITQAESKTLQDYANKIRTIDPNFKLSKDEITAEAYQNYLKALNNPTYDPSTPKKHDLNQLMNSAMRDDKIDATEKNRIQSAANNIRKFDPKFTISGDPITSANYVRMKQIIESQQEDRKKKTSDKKHRAYSYTGDAIDDNIISAIEYNKIDNYIKAAQAEDPAFDFYNPTTENTGWPDDYVQAMKKRAKHLSDLWNGQKGKPANPNPNRRSMNDGYVWDSASGRWVKGSFATDRDGNPRNAGDTTVRGLDQANQRDYERARESGAYTPEQLSILRQQMLEEQGGGRGPRKYATGGMVHSVGLNAGGLKNVENSDTIPAMLTPGEFVINREAASKFGHDNLRKINGGNVEGFAKGGSVGGVAYAAGGTPNMTMGGGGNIDISSITKGINSALSSGASFIKEAFNSGGLVQAADSFKQFTEILQSFVGSVSNITMTHTVNLQGSVSIEGLNVDEISKTITRNVGTMVANKVEEYMKSQNKRFNPA